MILQLLKREIQSKRVKPSMNKTLKSPPFAPKRENMFDLAPAGGGPEGGYARTPVGTHPHLLVMDVGNPVAVPCTAR
jgi:hypothetical protein